MSNWGCLIFRRGETVEQFAEQFKHLDKFKSAKIPWEALGGILAKEDLVKDIDGSISVLLPIGNE